MQDKTYILELAYSNGTAKHWKVDRNRAFDLFERENRMTISELSGYNDHRPTLSLYKMEHLNGKFWATSIPMQSKVYHGMDADLLLEIGRLFGDGRDGRPFMYGQIVDIF